MCPEILDSNQYQLLPLIESFKKEFYLVGGTAIALQSGHRRSIDFDLFKTKSFNRKKIISQIENQRLAYKLIYHESDQLHISVNNVKLTFFEYGFEIPHPVWFEKIISMPTLVDLAAMKAYALGRRAKWKDYVDLYWLLKNVYTLKEICIRAEQLFGGLFSEKLFRQQLCYFKDINFDEEIIYIKEEIPKETIEKFLTEVSLNGIMLYLQNDNVVL
jgi:hypothetical protein